MSTPAPDPFSEPAPDTPLEQAAYILVNVALEKEYKQQSDINHQLMQAKQHPFDHPFEDPYIGVDIIIGANEKQYLLSYQPDPATGEIKTPAWITKRGVDRKREAAWAQLVKKMHLAYLDQRDNYEWKFEEGASAAFIKAFDISAPAKGTIMIKKKDGLEVPLLSGGENRAEDELRKAKERTNLIDEVLGDLQYTPTARALLETRPTIFRDQLEHYKRVFENDPRTMHSMPTAKKSGIGDDLWCICRHPDDGREMIQCDAAECREWYHFDCIGLNEAPEGTWLCAACSSD